MVLHYRGFLIVWNNLTNQWVLNEAMGFNTLKDLTKHVDNKLEG